VLLAAHSLGCLLTAWWAAHSRHTHASGRRAAGGAARDRTRRTTAPANPPAGRRRRGQRLPFASIVVASSDDALRQPRIRGSRPGGRLGQPRFTSIGARGHINAESGLGDWDEGLALLRALISSHSSAADLFPGPDPPRTRPARRTRGARPRLLRRAHPARARKLPRQQHPHRQLSLPPAGARLREGGLRAGQPGAGPAGARRGRRHLPGLRRNPRGRPARPVRGRRHPGRRRHLHQHERERGHRQPRARTARATPAATTATCIRSNTST
jgi:hypothetical protein